VSGMPLVAWCPAKVNLSLRVVGRREDGYHELETRFQAIDLWDRIEARADERLTLACEDPAVPCGPENLVLRAASAMRDLAPRRALGAALRLTKRIPVQGGLGGGSSDAAGALLLCARLWGLEPDAEVVQGLARELGADVPFFLFGGTADGTGRGDRIRTAEYLGDLPILLGIPPFGLSTREVFAAFAPRLTPRGGNVSVRASSGAKSRGDNDFSFMVNDLESVAFSIRPELGAFRDALLEAGALGALLCGSGSSVFGLFAEGTDLAPMAARLGERFARFRIVATRAVARGAYLADPAEGDAG